MELQNWLIGQAIALFVLVTFGLAIRILVEKKIQKEISIWAFLLPIVFGFTAAALVQYFILFGAK